MGTFVVRRHRRSFPGDEAEEPVLAGLIRRHGALARGAWRRHEVRPAVMIGFVGAYATFSTWMLESWRLPWRAALAAAAVNVVGSVAAG